MAKMIAITAKKEGFRRCGISHPGTETLYPADRFSSKVLAALKAEPMLVVYEKETADPETGKKQK